MRFAYADPPYPGQSKRLYGDHPDYAGEVDHAELVARLERDYPDGWALSTGSKMLRDILLLCPADVRVLSWYKPASAPPMGDGFMYGWEPVVLHGGRRPAMPVMTHLTASPSVDGNWSRPGDHITGSKPPAFCRWIFRCLGVQPGDELDDLFPGSGGVRRAWEAFQAQGRLVA